MKFLGENNYYFSRVFSLKEANTCYIVQNKIVGSLDGFLKYLSIVSSKYSASDSSAFDVDVLYIALYNKKYYQTLYRLWYVSKK